MLNNVLEYVETSRASSRIAGATSPHGRLLISTLNPIWTPLLRVGARLGLSTPDTQRNFITGLDAANLLLLNGFEVVHSTRRTFLPKRIPLLAPLVNLMAAQTPGLRRSA